MDLSGLRTMKPFVQVPILVGLVLVVLDPSFDCQEKPLRVDVEMATVEVAVLDRQGHPVHNLKRDDFRLREEGKERPILTVDEVTPLPPGTPVNSEALSDRPGKIVLLLFDDGTLAPARLALTRELAAGFVRRSMNPGDLFGVASHALSLRLLQPFTQSVPEVLKAVQQPAVSYARNLGAAPTTRDLQRDSITGPRFRSPRLVDVSEQEMQESRVRGLSLFQTLKELCSSLARVRGRKTILLFTEDLRVPPDLKGTQQQTTSSAQAANVVIHSIDVRALSAGTPHKRSQLEAPDQLPGLFAFQGQNRTLGNAASEIGSEAPFDERDPLRRGRTRSPVLEDILRALAVSTGGEAIFNQSDLGEPLDRLNNAMSNYYVLGFSPLPLTSRTGLRHIEVQTVVKDAELKYLKHYVPSRSEDHLADSSKERQVQSALSTPTALSQFGVNFETAFFHEAGSGGLTNIQLAVRIGHEALKLHKQGSRRVGTAEIAGVAHSLDGQVAGRFSESIRVDLDSSEESAFRSRPLLYHTSLELRPGTYRLKIVVSGENGNVGAAERVFAVPSLPSSALSMSSVVITQQMVQMPALIQSVQDRLLEETSPLRYRGAEIAFPVDLEFERQSSIVVFFRLYNLESIEQARGLTASIQLINDYDQGGSFPPRSLADVAYPAGEHEAAVGLSLPLSELAPGNYRLRVETTDPAGKVAVASEARLKVK